MSDLQFDIVFESEGLIAVDKPAAVLTTPARDPSDSRPCLGRVLQARMGQQIYPVHRLDFEVSGLVLFAKTTDAHRISQKWFEEGVVKKSYQAITKLPPGALGGSTDWQEWRSILVRGKRRTFEAGHGKPSLTRARAFKVSESAGELFEFWELQPVTGRPHQLRFEMAKHARPILGDILYGGVPSARVGIALRAVSLDFSGIEIASQEWREKLFRDRDGSLCAALRVSDIVL